LNSPSKERRNGILLSQRKKRKRRKKLPLLKVEKLPLLVETVRKN